MSAPDRLQRALGDEEPIASTRLGGDDALVVTPTRSILYRAGGVLSDESVAEFTHDAERITVSESRRKATITLEYGLEGSDTFTVPTGSLEAVLKSLLAVNLSATDVITAEETVQAVFFFDELTLVITDAQVAKHVGSAVWDEDYDSIPFEEVTGLAFESGRVNTQVVLELGTTAERIKTPQERARAVREALQEALCQFHGVDSIEALEETLAAAAPERESRDSVDAITLGEDFDLLSRDDGASASATYESDTGDDALDGLYQDRRGRTEGASDADGPATAEATDAGEAASTGGSSVARASRVTEQPETDSRTPADVAEPATPAGQADADAGGKPDEPSENGAGGSAGTDRSGDGEPTASDEGPAAETGDQAPEVQSPETDVAADDRTVDTEALADHVADLATVLDRQAELIEEQRRVLDDLLETIDRGDD
jgi:hypothetical protein